LAKASVRQTIQRVLNGIRKVAAGLRPFSESVWPGVRNDLFVAHESIYRFFASEVRNRDVLDAGCGTGYGSHILAEAGAKSVIGVDLDRRNIAFARKRYAAPNLAFAVADIEKLEFGADSFDLVVASNSVEHLHRPRAFLDELRRLLRPGGKALIAVPPIYTHADAQVHAGIHYHRSNLSVAEWAKLLGDTGFTASGFLHTVRGTAEVDFTSHLPSRLSPEDFLFIPTTIDGLSSQVSITAVFYAAKPR
jgi:2-polyprenyl-3-methyl-5-hydroxy-6-metoxy-1,4-benzoquinol methylase